MELRFSVSVDPIIFTNDRQQRLLRMRAERPRHGSATTKERIVFPPPQRDWCSLKLLRSAGANAWDAPVGESGVSFRG